MGEFFKGWRRKMGCITLVMACMFIVGWVRSYFYMDVGGFQSPSFSCGVFSNLDGLGLSIHEHSSQTLVIPFKIVWPQCLGDAQSDRLDPKFFDWHTESCGIHFAEKSDPPPSVVTRMRVLIFPYVLITVPLTLFSAWLLVSKQPAVKRTAEPPKDHP